MKSDGICKIRPGYKVNGVRIVWAACGKNVLLIKKVLDQRISAPRKIDRPEKTILAKKCVSSQWAPDLFIITALLINDLVRVHHLYFKLSK